MIPKIDVLAAYSAFTDFEYTYNGDQYYFQTVGQNAPPSGFSFDDTVLNYVIEKDSQAFQVQIAGKNPFSNVGLGIKIAEFYNGMWSGVFQLLFNARIAINQTAQNWFTDAYSVYGWQYEFTGSDPNYEGYSLYGTAYGFRFTGYFGETIDVVLDQNGDFYGSNIISNYTFTDIDDELNWVSIHQIDGDDIWVSMNTSSESDDLPMPYFEGNTLHFFARNHGSSTHGEYTISNMENTSIVLYRTGSNQGFLSLFSLDQTQNHNWVISYPDNQTFTFSQVGSVIYTNWRSYLDSSVNGTHVLYGHQFFNNYVHLDINLPLFYFQWNNTVYPVTQNNTLGFNDNIAITGIADIYLNKLPFTTVPNPVDVPTGVPIPADEIPTGDPTDFNPDPSEHPDPVPGIDYPDPDPDPVPLPPIPSVVSGNDDLWPDLNDYFNTEDDIIDFTFPAVNVEFPDLTILLGNFVNSFTWVSTIITALFNGSDFSVLFSVLAFFFIAAAVLGIYKWWK